MTLPVWPSTLPLRFPTDVYQATLLTTGEATAMDSGPDRQRRRDIDTWHEVTTRERWTAAEFAAFLAFHVALGGGLGRFTAPVPRPSGVIVSRTCYLPKGDYAPTVRGPWIFVGFAIRILNYHD